MSRRKRRRGGLGWLLLAALLLGGGVVAGAWLAGWRWSAWQRPQISDAPASAPRPAEAISEAERRVLKGILRERPGRTGN